MLAVAEDVEVAEGVDVSVSVKIGRTDVALAVGLAETVLVGVELAKSIEVVLSMELLSVAKLSLPPVSTC